MNAYELQQEGLPGGLLVDHQCIRAFHFKALTGDTEFLLQETAGDGLSRPERISLLLSQVVDNIGDHQVDISTIRSLSIGDRDYLLQAFAATLHDDPLWLTSECRHCKQLMDLSFRFAELPAKRIADNAVKEKAISLSSAEAIIRVPTGYDHEAIAAIDDDQSAISCLLGRLVSVSNQTNNKTCNNKKGSSPAQTFIKNWSQDDLAKIEVEIEAISPEVADQLLVQCPHCQTDNRVKVDVFSLLHESQEDILAEVHQLAASYHWSEAEILNLPTARRKRYLQLIDRAKGVSSHHHAMEMQ